MVRFTLSRGDVAELPYDAKARVRAGDLIVVSGWRVWIETVVEDGTEYTTGTLIGHVVRTTPALRPPGSS